MARLLRGWQSSDCPLYIGIEMTSGMQTIRCIPDDISWCGLLDDNTAYAVEHPAIGCMVVDHSDALDK